MSRTLPTSNVVPLRPPGETRRLIAAADEVTLRALALVDDDDGRMARAELYHRAAAADERAMGSVMETADRMLGHADRIDYLLGHGPAADLIFDYATGQERR